MNRGNVSFTFLDRVKEVELNIEDGRWQSALALALTLPDICGGIAFPDIVKRYRDGRIMLDRQKIQPVMLALSISAGLMNMQEIFLKYHQKMPLLISAVKGAGSFGVNIFIRIKDFSLYNTPVLDFIQARQGTRTNLLIAVLCKNQTYANGIRLSLKQISEQVLVFNTPEEARKTLGKRKPVIWIVADETVKKKASSWKESGNRPVILLSKHTSKISLTEENKGKLRMLKLPVMPEDLRNAVNACLR